jgi:hypothetical protein
MQLTLIPAYGRDYKSAAACLADWNAGKDFQIASINSPDMGRYISKREAREGMSFVLRYAGTQKLVIVEEVK